MKIVFIGETDFSEAVLYSLLNKVDVEVVGVITREIRDAPGGDSRDLSLVWTPSRYDIDVAWIKEKRPDAIFCIGWHEIIGKGVLDICPVIGYHPTLLPKNRGNSPIIWALVNNDVVTGSTFFYMDEGMDSGNIISQVRVDISIADNARTIYKRLVGVALHQLPDVIRLVSSGDKGTPQNHSQATINRKRYYNDGEIDLNASFIEGFNKIRALSEPYPGAHFVCDGVKYKIRMEVIKQ
jgi:methionyl-tRNA formyltransferase